MAKRTPLPRPVGAGLSGLRPTGLAGLLVCLALCLAVGRAEAHAVFIFAWHDGRRVCTESYFSKKSKVRGGEVSMADAGGLVLASGRTDTEGLLCFDAPARAGDLHFTVLAGQGHKATFTLPPAVVDVAPDVPAPAERPDPASREESLPPDNASTAGPHAAALEETLLPLLRKTLREELDRELSPLRRALAQQGQQDGQSVGDIVGGIGWIVGLAGLAALFASRRKGR
ncbi:MAG: hypothetical protein LBH65_04145 [Desulfovibrio sp.]|nr:hypothetical protein [Desulfovibrio sp.]